MKKTIWISGIVLAVVAIGAYTGWKIFWILAKAG